MAGKEESNNLPKSERRFRSFFEYNPLMCFMVDAEGTVRDVNALGAEELGYTKEELIGHSVLSVFHPEDRNKVLRHMTECLRKTDQMYSWELRKVRKNGETIHVREVGRAVEDSEGTPMVLITCENISAQKQIEEEMKISKAHLAAVIENTQDVIWSVDKECRILTMNNRFRELFYIAYKTRLMPGMDILEHIPAEIRPLWARFYERTFRGERFTVEQHFEFPGVWLDMEISFNPIVSSDGLITGAAVYSRDITEMKKRESALREIEERYRQMFDKNEAVKWLIDPETGTIVDANSAAAKFYGYPLEKLKTMTVSDINILSPEEIKKRLVDAQASYGTFNFQHRLANGDIREVELHTGPIVVKGKRLLFSIIHDITERKKAEKALRESEEKYRSIFENITEGIYHATESGEFITINPSLVKMLGYSSAAEVMKLNLNRDVYADPDDRIALNRETRTKGKSYYVEVNWKKKDGTLFRVRLNDRAVFDTQGNFQYYEVTVEDVSEQRRLEEHLIQSQKIESIGRIAGGVAHDMNNMLAVILPTAEMLKNLPHDTELVKKYSDVIAGSARRAADIVKQLLVFSRKTPSQMSPMDINALIMETQKMLEHVLGKNVRIRIQLENELPYVEADVTQMQQVLMNLSVNARDAMSGAGELLFTTRQVWLDGRSAGNLDQIVPGNYIELKVTDTGSGIPEELIPKVFDAFFSTKHAGQGTGLGLAVVKSIILKHRGYIDVVSKLNHGTTFTIYLPVSETYADTGHIMKTAESPRGSESILIVDDEEEILKVGKKIFGDLGYRIRTADNGLSAIDMYRKEKPDLVLLDIQMPGIDGRETLRRLREIDPAVNALYITGYARPELLNAIEESKEAEIIQKPFSIQEMAGAIRKALKVS